MSVGRHVAASELLAIGYNSWPWCEKPWLSLAWRFGVLAVVVLLACFRQSLRNYADGRNISFSVVFFASEADKKHYRKKIFRCAEY